MSHIKTFSRLPICKCNLNNVVALVFGLLLLCIYIPNGDILQIERKIYIGTSLKKLPKYKQWNSGKCYIGTREYTLANQSFPTSCVFSTMLFKYYSFLPAVQSLRYFNNYSTYVIQIDKNLLEIIPQDLIYNLSLCNIYFDDIGVLNSSIPFSKLCEIRYIYFYSLLKECNFLKQIIYIDIFDSVYQSDPFDEPFDGIYVSTHPFNFNVNSWNYNRLKVLTKNASQVGRKPIINGGIIWGDYNSMIEFLVHYVAETKVEKVDNIGVFDQTYINYLFYFKKNLFRKITIEYTYRTKFVSLWSMPLLDLKYPHLCYNISYFPKIVHQYYLHTKYCLTIADLFYKDIASVLKLPMDSYIICSKRAKRKGPSTNFTN